MSLDVNTMRSIVTVLAFVSFLGIVWWAWHRASRARFEEAAQLPFADDALPLSPAPLPQGERGVTGRARKIGARKDHA